MSVKFIFKALLGTIVIIVSASIIIELFNISVSSFQLTQMAKMACQQSAILFSQETYKERVGTSGTGGATNMDNIEAADGSMYVSGDFYGIGKSAVDIYTDIYRSPEFISWVNSPVVAKGNWKSVDLINRALNNPSSLRTTMPTNILDPLYESQLEEYTDSMLALSYRDVMMTPLNMGIPYMDEDILNSIFRWNMAQIASYCNSNTIRKDANGNNCIYYNGFRVYADRAMITNIEYRVYDTEDPDEKLEFEELTHIDVDNLGFDDSLINYLGGYANDDERRRICVIGLEYSVPIAYEGITPIKSIFNFVWNTEVDGLNGGGGHTAAQQYWNDATTNLESGGFDGSNVPAGVLPVPGRLIYYLVR